MTYEEAIKILGDISIDYTGMTLLEVNRMDEALTLAFNALSILHKIKRIPATSTKITDTGITDIDRIAVIDCLQHELAETKESLKKANERIQELEAQLEESRAKEGKGCLETMVERFGQLALSVNEALKVMTPEEIKELLRPDEEEEDHEEDRDTESE